MQPISDWRLAATVCQLFPVIDQIFRESLLCSPGRVLPRIHEEKGVCATGVRSCKPAPIVSQLFAMLWIQPWSSLCMYGLLQLSLQSYLYVTLNFTQSLDLNGANSTGHPIGHFLQISMYPPLMWQVSSPVLPYAIIIDIKLVHICINS